MKKIAFLLILISLFHAKSQEWSPKKGKMMTRWGKQVTPNNAWQEYPRPQFVRRYWANLNGLWDFSMSKINEPKPEKFKNKILVPFSVESTLSGVGKSVSDDTKMWYKRYFKISKDWEEKDIILNFEAVDYDTAVWLNGILVGTHKGGFDRFSFDITKYLNKSGSQELIVSVKDKTNLSTQPRGKQQLKPSGIYYTPVSGIWQTVWLEAVSPEAYIKEVKILSDIDNNTLTITPLNNKPTVKSYETEVEVFWKGKKISRGIVNSDKSITLKINNPHLWSPDIPNLYDLKLRLINNKGEVIDTVDSYFGMRKISLGDHMGVKYLFLNNTPLFHYGTLDQGWWPDGLLTPPSDSAMKFDIVKTKEMGFNMIRKHVKVESDRWFYHCDKLGILVWQDMPSMSFQIQKTPDEIKNSKKPERVYRSPQRIGRYSEDLKRRSKGAAQFEYELKRMINIHFNSPSVVMWVPFNEGWGQYDSCRIANLIKALDPSRLVNPTSGWSLRPCGDINDIHDYSVDLERMKKFLKISATSVERATVIGEYGGIGYQLDDHIWDHNMKNFGYQSYQTDGEVLKNYIHKFNQILSMKKNNGLSAAVYTQTTDVESEINGLMTYDREVIKMPVKELREMHLELYK
jgi:beta-galactosidase/beta-glucuronidase